MRKKNRLYISGAILVFLLILNCQMQSVNEPERTAKVILNFKIKEFVQETDPSMEFNQGVMNKPMDVQTISEVKIVFFDFEVDSQTIVQQYGTKAADLNSLIDNFPGEETSFEQYWIARDQAEFNIVSDGNYSLEKRANLTVSGDRAYGEFELSEGLKTCRIGCFEQGQLTYVNRPENPQANNRFFHLIAGENTNIVIDLYEVTITAPTPPGTDQLEWVTVNGGTFQMGSDNGEFDEQPVHTVTVNTFYINKYEITNSQYCEFLNARGVAPDGSYGGIDYIDIDITGCQITYSGNQFIPENGKDSHPVNYVTWDGAGAYCVWAGVRLPTEAEWEFAARGGNQSLGYIYSGSDNVDDVGWYVTNAVNESHPVGQKLPNELGLYDMSGNVWEWCSDWYSSGYYGISPTSNPQGPDSGTNHAVRGGSYLISGDNLRSANRQDAGNWGWISVGFRCVKNQ